MIRFSKYIWLYFFFSALVLVPGIYSLVRFGLRQSIDFTGGTIVEVKLANEVAIDTLEEAVRTSLPVVSLQSTGDKTFLFRFKPMDQDATSRFQKTLEPVVGSVEIVRNETVGPILGSELLRKATFAAVIAIIAILLYVAYALKSSKYGISAVLALTHDLLVVLGVFSLLGYFWGVEVDTLFVTAFLTTMSFSVHDTIVIFDRIREYLKKGERRSFAELTDIALTETMNRSLTNSLTIIFMLLALILLGGSTIKWFIVALLIGTISGTYSSPFVATPLLILWDKWENRKRKA
jgi:preprotein translocase subunit SecF